MGVAGIAYTFDLFAQRTGSARDEDYAEGAARYVQHLISPRIDAVPEQPGQPGWDTGYLSGSAGDAFMFLSLYHHTHDRQWLRDADRLLGFVEHTGQVHGARESWPIEYDRSGRQDNNAVALGTEEGSAGIGWVLLNAYEVTGARMYLAIARRAGNYLLAHLTHLDNALTCVEDIGGGNTTSYHTSLDNGAAGCGYFLHDLYVTTGDRKYPGRRALDRYLDQESSDALADAASGGATTSIPGSGDGAVPGKCPGTGVRPESSPISAVSPAGPYQCQWKNSPSFLSELTAGSALAFRRLAASAASVASTAT